MMLRRSLRLRSAARAYTGRPQVLKKRRPKPDEIWSPEPGKVRLNGITMRDGHQSLTGGQHRIEHLEKAATLIGQTRRPGLEHPGAEEIGGGTVVDFPLRFKGEHPFRNIERMCQAMPDTYTMALIRADNLCSYTCQPRDVVQRFIHMYYQSGIDAFRVFDAYNNPENHARVSEAINEIGGHYQGTITFTTHHDVSLHNPRWIGNMAKELAKLGAHSICLKDMAGIATPAMMKTWVSAVKDAVPHLPVIIHAHYTTGFSPFVYLDAIEAGATAVDCGISTLSGRTGHPALEVLARVLRDRGHDVGMDQDKLAKVAEYYAEIYPDYAHQTVDMPGGVDYRVFLKGIPGGQFSIFKQELERNGIGDLFDSVLDNIAGVRDDAGGVALVTPTADCVARQATLNALDEHADRKPYTTMWPGYSEMLRGAMGVPPMPCNKELINQALREHAMKEVDAIAAHDLITDELKTTLKASGDVELLQRRVWELAEAPRLRQLLKKLRSRIAELESLTPAEVTAMNVCAVDEKQSPVKVADKVASLKAQVDEMQERLDAVKDAISDEEYETFLAQEPNPESRYYKPLLDNCPVLTGALQSGELTHEGFHRILAAACFITVPPSRVLKPGLDRARAEVEALAAKHGFPIPEHGSIEMDEYTVLQSMFRDAQDIATNFFKHHRVNQPFWPKPNGLEYPEFDLGLDGAGLKGGIGAPVEEGEAVKLQQAPAPEKMYPFVTKSDPSTTEIVQHWSDDELKRILADQISALRDINRATAGLNAQLKTKGISSTRTGIIEERLFHLKRAAFKANDEARQLVERTSALLRAQSTTHVGSVSSSPRIDVDKTVEAGMLQFASLVESRD